MISPTMYLLFIYILAVPMIAAIAVFIWRKSIPALVLALLCLTGIIYSVSQGGIAIEYAIYYVIPAVIYIVAIFNSSLAAVACVREWVDGGLRIGSVAKAAGYYFLFLVIVFITLPPLRWCEGCMEWH